MDKPTERIQWILDSKVRKAPKRTAAERKEEWNDAVVSTLREKWIGEINELSLQWKEIRAEKEANKKLDEANESSEGEVDIIAETVVAPKSPRRKGKNTQKPAARVRG